MQFKLFFIFLSLSWVDFKKFFEIFYFSSSCSLILSDDFLVAFPLEWKIKRASFFELLTLTKFYAHNFFELSFSIKMSIKFSFPRINYSLRLDSVTWQNQTDLSSKLLSSRLINFFLLLLNDPWRWKRAFISLINIFLQTKTTKSIV